MPYLNDGKTFKVYLPNLEKNVSKGGEIDENLSGRLLTPEQGCGITQVTQTKIVGGKPSKKCKLLLFDDFKIEMTKNDKSF